MNSTVNKPPTMQVETLAQTIKKVLVFSSPIIMNSLLGILPSFISIWFLSQLGQDHMAAAGIAMPTFYTILTFFIVGFTAVGIKVGHSFGKGNENNEIGLWVRNGLFLAIIMGIPASIVLLNADTILLWFGQKPHLVELTRSFFSYGALVIFVILINTVFNQYISAIGHPKIALILSVITLPLIVALSYVLVLGKYGFPSLGLGGINAAAFVIDSICAVCAACIIVGVKWSKPYSVFSRPSGISAQYCKALVKLGWPISIQVSGELSAMTVSTYFIGWFGASALAAAQITFQFVMIVIMIILGLSQGVSILVSHAYGKANIAEIKKIALSGVILSGVVTCVLAIGFIIFPQTLIDFYLRVDHPIHNQLVHIATYFMMIGVVGMAFDGVRNVLTSTLRAMHDPKVPMQIGVFCLWLIGLPCAYIVGVLLHGGAIGVRLGWVVGIIVASIWLIYRTYHKFQVKSII